jgi:uncharacterized membrane protein (UPF0127 family)
MRLCAFLILLGLAGCEKDPKPASVAPAAVSPPAAATAGTRAPTAAGSTQAEPVYHQDHALTGLPRVKLLLGTKETQAELCYTITQIATGLMHRKSIGTNETMLFVFAGPRDRSFYMKNVPFDIDVAYIDHDGVIQEIVRLKAQDAKGVPSKSSRIQFVLEAAPDYFTRNGFGPGTLISTERGSLAEVLSPLAQLN